MMKKLKLLMLSALGLLLGACGATDTGSSSGGESVRVNGKATNLTQEPLVRPLGIMGETYDSRAGTAVNLGIWGVLNTDGTFSLTLPEATAFYGNLQTILYLFGGTNCAWSESPEPINGLSVLLRVGSSYSPSLPVLILLDTPDFRNAPRFKIASFAYADRPTRARGTCTSQGYSLDVNINLQKGWNLSITEQVREGYLSLLRSITVVPFTGSIPSGLNWYVTN